MSSLNPLPARIATGVVVVAAVGLWLAWLGGGFTGEDLIAVVVATAIVVAVWFVTHSGVRQSLAIAVGLGAALGGFFLWQGWAGTPITTTSVITWLISGLAVGATYALYSTGLVVVYNTTGIFNFAQGAIGAFSAFLYWELRVNQDWPAPLALLVVIGIFAPLVGVLLDQLLMRWLEGAAAVTQLMVTVALMIGFLSFTGLIWDKTESRRLSPFFGTDSFALGDVNVTYHRTISLVTAGVIALGLRFLFRSRLGIAMRAVVDNRSLAGLNGARPAIVSSFAWAIGTTLAAIAGILVAPGREMDPLNLNIIIVTAFAAAAIGQLRSLSLAFAGALFIGLAESFNQQFLGFGGDWIRSTEGIAPILLFLVVIALPQQQLEVGRRVSKTLKPVERLPRAWEATIGALAVVVGIWALSRGHLSFLGFESWSLEGYSRGSQVFYTAIIGMSLVPLTGWAGQVNFAPLGFAGFGAWMFHVVSGGEGNVLWLPVAALACAPLGALVAIPVARLRGLYLALSSMAFAVMMETLFFRHPDVLLGKSFEAPNLFGTSFDRSQTVIVLTVIFGLVLVGLVALQRSRYGRRWIAMNDSESASATLGISTAETKIVVYALSAAIAGLGGALLASARGTIDASQEFTLFGGLPIVLLMAVAGMRYPSAGLFLGINTALFVFIPQWFEDKNYGFLFETIGNLGPALLAITLVANQRGAIADIGEGFSSLLPWRSDAREHKREVAAAKAEAEVNDLGLERPFTAEAVVDLDRHLSIVDDVTPHDGYPEPADATPAAH